MNKIQLRDNWPSYSGFSNEETAAIIAVQNLVNALASYKQFIGQDIKDGKTEINFSLEDLSGLNDAVLSKRIRVSLNPEMPENLYVHIAGTPAIRSRAFERLDALDDYLLKCVNEHLEETYYRIIYVDEGLTHSPDNIVTPEGTGWSNSLGLVMAL